MPKTRNSGAAARRAGLMENAARHALEKLIDTAAQGDRTHFDDVYQAIMLVAEDPATGGVLAQAFADAGSYARTWDARNAVSRRA